MAERAVMDALGELEKFPGSTSARVTRTDSVNSREDKASRSAGRWMGLRARLMLFVTAVLFAPFGTIGGATNGIEFAEEVATRLPGARILLTSGFTERATVEARKRDGRPLPFALLGKPYRKDEFARAVRAALTSGKEA